MVTFGGMRTPTNEYFNFLFINSPLHTRSRMLDMEPCPYSGNPMYIYRVERQTPRGLYAEKQHHEVDGSLSPDELLPQTTQSPRFSYSSSHIAQTDGSRTPSSSSSDKSSASTAPSVASSLRPLEGTLAPLGDHPIVQPQPVSSQTDHYNFLTGVEYLPEGDNHADGSASVVLSHPAFEPHSMAAYVPLSRQSQSTLIQQQGFRCRWENCTSSTIFRREGDLIRHLKTIHISPNAYRCPEWNCNRSFGRRDHLQAHRRQRHHISC